MFFFGHWGTIEQKQKMITCFQKLFVHLLFFSSRRASVSLHFNFLVGSTMPKQNFSSHEPNQEEYHLGTCKGKGLRMKGYHGYFTTNDGSIREKLCSCCMLDCETCSTYARNALRNQNWGSPVVKAPPDTPTVAYKPPPAKRMLYFTGEQGQIFYSQHCLV